MASKEELQQIVNQSWIYYWKYLVSMMFLPIIGIFFTIYFSTVMSSLFISISPFLISVFTSVIIYLYIYIQRASHRLYIYKTSILYEKGFFNKIYKEIKKKNIRAVEIDQPFIHRILHIGTLKFATSGTGGYEIVFEGVKYPHKIKRSIDKELKEMKKMLEKKKKIEEMLELEKARKRRLKKTLRFVKDVKKKKTSEGKSKEEVHIFLKVYKDNK